MNIMWSWYYLHDLLCTWLASQIMMIRGDSTSRSFWGSCWIYENSVVVPKMSLHPAGSNFDASVSPSLGWGALCLLLLIHRRSWKFCFYFAHFMYFFPWSTPDLFDISVIKLGLEEKGHGLSVYIPSTYRLLISPKHTFYLFQAKR